MTSILAPHLILADPLTPAILVDWIEACENEFDKFEVVNPTISDKSKIAFAGSALLSSQPAIEGLRQWWKSNSVDLKKGTWPDFVEKVKTEALGRHRCLDALAEVYRIQQNDKSVDAYISEFRAARDVVSLVDARAMDEHQYKRLLLFRANPSIYATARAVPGFTLNTISLPHLEGLLREYESAAEQNK